MSKALQTRLQETLARLRAMADPDLLANEQRLAIKTEGALGISIWDLRKLAKEVGKDQPLAEALWKTDIREARLLAGYLADPEQISEDVIEAWVADFDSWDLCDQVSDAFLFSPFGYQKAFEWSERPEEFVKRTAFVLMSGLAFYDKEASDEKLMEFFPVILREATDERNFVKKAVNWALRNIGKRNLNLNRQAIALAEQIAQLDSKAAQWIARDAIKELTSEKVRARLEKKAAA
jgi:3-methyladenine DNA glycosylase AlkD